MVAASPTMPHLPAMPAMRRIRHIHCIGICGAGMCGVAEVLHNSGYEVSGSDLRDGATAERLRKIGIRVHKGHAAKQADRADAVVVSQAVAADNPELLRARQRRVPVVPRAQMLAELMRYRYGIAVAGSHGKTTTTSMIAGIFSAAGMDPTFVVGGLVRQAATNARLGQGRYFIAEADESDGSFLHLQPMLAVVTNMNADHLDAYDGQFSRLQDAFVSFVHNLPFYGAAVICADDPDVAAILPRINRPVHSFGFAGDADFRITNFAAHRDSSSFVIERPGELAPLNLRLQVPGRHNALNAAAAAAVATDEGLDDRAIVEGLAGFVGVGRRFEIVGRYCLDGAEVMLVDDYGHHPGELAATIEAVRQGFPGRRLVMLFQPHRYSRMRDLYEDFVQQLSGVDILILLEVFGAGEEPIPHMDSRHLCGSIRQRGSVEPLFAADMEEAVEIAGKLLAGGDLVLIQGAGNVSQAAPLMAAMLEERADG